MELWTLVWKVKVKDPRSDKSQRGEKELGKKRSQDGL
jgi:hypothetical protein